MRFKRTGRYDVSGLVEAQFEPGSHGRVLRNVLGITRQSEMDTLEAQLLEEATDALVRTHDRHHRFTAADLCQMHRVWLGRVYVWAGHYRSVNLSKGEFPFAPAERIPNLMRQFEQKLLGRYTPCRFRTQARVVKALAVVHVELVLIHPFRDGNGRVARILATLMALQAGLPLLDFSSVQGRTRQAYFSAVKAGLDENYRPMEQIFSEIVRKTRAIGRTSKPSTSR